jgi:hypothetical protein
VAGLAALFLLSGCELLVDFDRSKIPQDSGTPSFEGATGEGDGGDATVAQGDGASPSTDATLPDGASEAAAPSEASPSDAPAAETSATDSAPETSGPSDSSTPEAAKTSDGGSETSTGEAGPAEAASPGSDASDASASASDDSG